MSTTQISENNEQKQNKNTQTTASTGVFSLSDEQTKEFIEDLVLLVAGVPVEDIPENVRLQVISDTVDMYLEFINNYTKKNKGKRVAIQNKIFQANEDISVLSRFEGLDESLKEAHNEFINQLNQ